MDLTLSEETLKIISSLLYVEIKDPVIFEDDDNTRLSEALKRPDFGFFDKGRYGDLG